MAEERAPRSDPPKVKSAVVEHVTERQMRMTAIDAAVQLGNCKDGAALVAEAKVIEAFLRGES